MTDSTPVGRITAMLAEADYRPLPSPLVIGGLKFEFAAVLVGTLSSSDLIVVADMAYEQETRLMQKIEAVARALDVARSTRSLTCVLVGPRPAAATLDALARVARVLPIGVVAAANDGDVLRDWLAVLLPLKVPSSKGLVADPLERMHREVAGLSPEVQSLVAAAEQGAGAVQERLHQLIEAPFIEEGDAK